jgi:ATP-dependent protease HslVU (ClpYQ) peptidase subunit
MGDESRKRGDLPQRDSVTICIAAACDNGKMIVAATDGLLSLGDVTGDNLIAKVIWKGEWQFMYAGLPGNIAMILGELDEMVADNPEWISRRKVQGTIKAAFRKFVANYSSFELLSPFDMTLDEFKREGLTSLGQSTHDDLSSKIRTKAQYIQEQLLVTGWGYAPHSAMLYEVGAYGDQNHSYSGIAAIGSGARVAQSNLLMLGQSRDCTLATTIFNVAMAKFASEKSQDLDVGQRTAIYVSTKATPAQSDDPKRLHAKPLLQEEISSLRTVWDDHVRPRMPLEAHVIAFEISQRIVE